MRIQSKKLIIALVVVGIIFLIAVKLTKNELVFTREKLENNEKFSIDKIIYESKDGKEIYSHLFLPKSSNKVPIVIVLPAAEGTKESRRNFGELFIELGYATLIIDQRGIGETGGEVNSFEDDFGEFLLGKVTTQELMVVDAIQAINIMEKLKEIDSEKIAVFGTSMGGRFAIITAALDERIKTAIIVSSAGYNFVSENPDADRFISVINPNTYINQISPRRLLMLHSVNDQIIKFEDAKRTFAKAQEPKEFIELFELECTHGYCNPMYPPIRLELEEAFK